MTTDAFDTLGFAQAAAAQEAERRRTMKRLVEGGAIGHAILGAMSFARRSEMQTQASAATQPELPSPFAVSGHSRRGVIGGKQEAEPAVGSYRKDLGRQGVIGAAPQTGAQQAIGEQPADNLQVVPFVVDGGVIKPGQPQQKW